MKIAINRICKMGKEIEKIALERGHEIVSIIDINNQEEFSSNSFKSADVAIEFTAPTVAYQNYLRALKQKLKLFQEAPDGWKNMVKKLKTYAKMVEKHYSGHLNFSLGVAIFSTINKYLAKIMNQFPLMK